MARVSNKARLLAATSSLSVSAAGKLADLIESIVESGSVENIADLETRSAKRTGKTTTRRARATDEDEKPARKVRTTRAAKDEDEDEKPVRRTRKAAVVEDEKPVRKTRAPKQEPFDEDVTVDDLIDFMENFEGEAVEGSLTELKAQAEEFGLDVKAFFESYDEKPTAAEKREDLGMFVAASNALIAKIVATIKVDEGAFDEVIEELDLELRENARGSTIAKAIIVALNDEVEDADEDEDDQDDADEEEAAPVRRKKPTATAAKKPVRKTRAAVDEDEDEDEKPARRSKRKPVDEDEDLDDLSDLED